MHTTDDQWPTHEDGSRKRMKDMTSAERRQVLQRSAMRVAAQFNEPGERPAVSAVLRSTDN